MANLCQTDYEAVRPDRYFPETFRTGQCDACEDHGFVARASEAEVREAKHARLMALPITPARPDKLRGPELGARVRYTGTGRRHGMIGEVTERSYVWAPDTRYGDTRGVVRYDDSVVRFDDGVTLVIGDGDLTEVGS